MATRSLEERISASFAAWEIRGRGWMLADYPVALEPPYRPFFLLPDSSSSASVEQIDDGRRPTFLSTLAERIAAKWSGDPAPQKRAEAFEEQAPFPAYEREGLSFRRIILPPDFRSSSAVTEQLLQALTSGFHPASLEVIGHAGRAQLQLVTSTLDAENLFARVTDFSPSAALIEEDDVLLKAWRKGDASVVVDYGHEHEFFLPLAPLRAFSIDPYAPLISACARAGKHETLCFQVLFEQARNPWRAAILQAVVSPSGGSIFHDAPEFPGAAKEKARTPLCAAVLRVGACAETHERALDLVRGTNSFIAQFSRPGGNTLIPLTNDAYPDGAHEAALLTRHSCRTGMILSLEELAGLVHLPDASVKHPAFIRDERRTKALPASLEGNTCVIGDNVHRGEVREATLSFSNRLAHTMIVGASGTGKSTLLLNLILQDIARGDGCAVLDPHGDLIEEILARLPEERQDDVVVFDPSDEAWPVGFNMLSANTDLERNVLASDLVGSFQRLSTSWGDTMGTVLSNAVLAILESSKGGTLLDLRRFLVDDGFRAAHLATVSDQEVQFFWKKEWPLIGSRSIGPILTRLNTFLRPKIIRHIVGQKDSKVQLSEVVARRRIFLAKLSQGLIGNENAYLLGALLLSKFLQVALSRQGIPKDARHPYWLYVDEAEHFVTPSLASLLIEARKYGMGLHLGFHMLSQLRALPQVENALLSNAHTRIVFRVGSDDARKLGEGFSFFEPNDLQALGRGEAIARVGESTNDFTLRTRPAPLANSDSDSAETVCARSREQWAAPLQAVAEESLRIEPVVDEAPAQTIRPPVRATTHSIKVTNQAEPPPLGRGGPEHRYVQHLIKRLAEERGFRAVIEEPVQGGRIDVALSRGREAIACEISIASSAEQEIENARKCVSAGYKSVWIVVADSRRKAKMVSALASLAEATCYSVDELPAALGTALPREETSEKVVGGYTVRATRKAISYQDYEARKSAIAAVIAKSIKRKSVVPSS